MRLPLLLGTILSFLFTILFMPTAQAADYISIDSGGFKRQYILVTPKSASGPVPLVVVLHGTYGTGSKMQRGLGFDPYAEKYGFAVAYPDAYTPEGQRNTTRWNDGRGTLDSTKLGVDDVKFLRDMVKHIQQTTQIDSRRIFVTGASNGGMMAYRVACEAADVFAASAPVIGSIPKPIADKCNPSQPISLLAINGTADPFMPFAGGQVCSGVSGRFCEKGYVISAEQSLARFAKNASCSGAPRTVRLPAKFPKDPPIDKVTYSGCAQGASISAFWMVDGGHMWAPKKGQLIGKNGEPTRNLDATKEIVQFFMAHK